MRHVVSITIADAAWSKVPRLRKLAREAVNHALAPQGEGRRNCEIAIRFAGDREVAELNSRWRGKDRPTNVLSFPAAPAKTSSGEPQPLGDIILASGVVAAEAEEQGKSLEAHTAHLIVHGVLHLLGFDHGAETGARRMEESEVAILARMGYRNPYEPN